MTFKDSTLISDFRSSAYMQNNKIEIEMQLHEFSLIFLLNRIMTLWQANSDIIITASYWDL